MIEPFRLLQEGFALRGEFLSQRWERNQRIAGGRLRMDTLCPYSPYPGPPLRGTRTCWILQHFRRAKSEWLVSIPAGSLGPGWMENCVGCNSTAAPSLTEQVVAGPSSAGRSGTGPYERRDSFCIRRRGGCPHPPVPPPERDSWKNQAAKRSFAQSSFCYFSFKKSNASSRV